MALGHGNDGNSINNGGIKKNVTIKLNADTQEAVRSIRDLERQVNKLGDLADQGSRRQDGFLSTKQVQMYKRIMKEIEQTYSQHQKSLDKIDQQYDSARRGKEAKKLKELENDLKKRQALLRNSEGGNKWGDVSSPLIQEFHRNKLKEASDNHTAYKGSNEYKQYKQNVDQLRANRDTTKSAVDRIDSERSRAQMHSNRIGTMYERDPNARRYVSGASQLAANTGAVTSFGAYGRYTFSGIDVLRNQERRANTVGLRSGIGGENSDRNLRNSIYYPGESNNYDAGATADTQNALISGGTTGNRKKLLSDTNAVQKFARSYAMDPNEMAYSGASLQKMGSFNEGEQQKFANLLAGAISKGGMNGRQAEMLRATMTLAQSVSQGQAQYTQKQFSNVLGLQVGLGNAVPSLKGDRGAELLSNMDSAIKGGGQGLDLLMGKGTKYTGLHGMVQLQQLKEQGLSNPTNLQTILNNSDKMFGGNEDMTKLAMKEQLGLNLNEYDALKKSGFIDQIKKDPSSITSKQLKDVGAKELSKQWKQYSGSQTAKVDYLDSQSTNLKAKNAKGADAVAKTSRGFFHGLGDIPDIALLAAGGIGLTVGAKWGGGKIPRAIGNSVNRMMGRPISPPVPPVGGGPVILGPNGLPLPPSGGVPSPSTVANASRMSRIASGLKNVGTGTLKAMGTMSKEIPIAGAIIGTGVDRVVNPNHSWGRSLTKGVGSAIGGMLGLAGTAALGLGTGGAGLLAGGALTMGGAAVGDKAGDWLYSQFNGDSDTKAKKVSASSSPQSGSPDSKISSLNVENLNVNDKKISSILKESASPSTKAGKEQTFRIIIEGDIKGMNSKNQSEVKDSVTDFFRNGVGSNMFKYNLAFDQNRK